METPAATPSAPVENDADFALGGTYSVPFRKSVSLRPRMDEIVLDAAGNFINLLMVAICSWFLRSNGSLRNVSFVDLLFRVVAVTVASSSQTMRCWKLKEKKRIKCIYEVLVVQLIFTA
jgi:hypothetical protein